ncbi:MAG: hypothetical protein ABIJ96_00935 [Elusimicrobiota bacterium]
MPIPPDKKKFKLRPRPAKFRKDGGAGRPRSEPVAKRNLFIGGFPFSTTEEELLTLFAACGEVKHIKILQDKKTGRSRGIGFVEMATEAGAKAALARLNDAPMGQRKMFVSAARPPEMRPDGATGKPSADRRSGQDRRNTPSGGAERKWAPRPAFGAAPKDPWGRESGDGGKKKWERKPGGFGKKKWERKPGGAGPKKWERGPGSKKWGRKPDR